MKTEAKTKERFVREQKQHKNLNRNALNHSQNIAKNQCPFLFHNRNPEGNKSWPKFPLRVQVIL